MIDERFCLEPYFGELTHDLDVKLCMLIGVETD